MTTFCGQCGAAQEVHDLVLMDAPHNSGTDYVCCNCLPDALEAGFSLSLG